LGRNNIDSFYYYTSDTLERYSSCADLFSKGKTSSGVYTIEPDDFGSFDVFCDMKNSGGGWTVFQKRYEGMVYNMHALASSYTYIFHDSIT
jgi:hypothetical protein